MAQHSGKRNENENGVNSRCGEPTHNELALQNKGLQAALDQLARKLVDQEANSRAALSQTAAWGALQEQRARDMHSRLENIENSISWRVISKLNSSLDRYPSFRIALKRVLKLLFWTATGQLALKIRQFKEGRKQDINTNPDAPAESREDFYSFFIHPTSLPISILDPILNFMKEHGPVRLITTLNFYAGGGAESVALDYARAYALSNPDHSVLVVLTDDGPKRRLPELPDNVMKIDLTECIPDMARREDHLFLIFRTVSPNTIHIVNSIVAFNLLNRIPASFLSDINVVTSVFCLQFDSLDDTKIIGYGQDFLPSTIDKIDCVVTDNHRFAVEGPLRLRLATASEKFKVVYNKSKLDDVMTVDASLKLLGRRLRDKSSVKRCLVHWAGRLDRQKRPDLLARIAELSEDFCDFHVFGSSVVDGDYEALLKERSNVRLCGPYRSPEEWDLSGTGNVFLFTSREEGMPNALIEASYLGYPIIASDVGGVCELVNSQTGWAIDKLAPAEAYVDALRNIVRDQTEVMRRTEKLIELAHSRHNEQSYLQALAKIPGYERVSK